MTRCAYSTAASRSDPAKKRLRTAGTSERSTVPSASARMARLQASTVSGRAHPSRSSMNRATALVFDVGMSWANACQTLRRSASSLMPKSATVRTCAASASAALQGRSSNSGGRMYRSGISDSADERRCGSTAPNQPSSRKLAFNDASSTQPTSAAAFCSRRP